MSKSFVHTQAFNVTNQYDQKITVSVDAVYKRNIQLAFKSNLIRPIFFQRKDNGERQLRAALCQAVECKNGTTLSAGKTVSFFPLIGVKPNSKRREREYDFDYSSARFNPKRYTPAISVNDWWDWIRSGLEYDEWLAAEQPTPLPIVEPSDSDDDDKLDIAEILKKLKGKSDIQELEVELEVEQEIELTTPTTMELLLHEGLTREEAIQAITSRIFEGR